MAVSHQTIGGTPWTKQDFDHVLQRWNGDGASAGMIAREIGRSRNAICGLIDRNRDKFEERSSAARALRSRRQAEPAALAVSATGGHAFVWSDADAARAEDMWAEGQTIQAMADALGKSRESVNRHIQKRRDKFPNRKRGRGDAPVVPVRRPPPAVRSGVTETVFDGVGISLLDLTSQSCRFPVSGEKAAMLFCGATVVGTSSWCRCHYLRVTERAAADTRGAA